MRFINALSLASMLVFLSIAHAENPEPNLVKISDFDFAETHGHSSWLEIPAGEPEFMKSVSIKFKKENEDVPIEEGQREHLTQAVKDAALEKCREIAGSSTRPEQPAAASLQLSSEISSSQVATADGKFIGKYVCAIRLKP